MILSSKLYLPIINAQVCLLFFWAGYLDIGYCFISVFISHSYGKMKIKAKGYLGTGCTETYGTRKVLKMRLLNINKPVKSVFETSMTL